jgi:peptide/nickel transport system ATP-binding protein
MEPTNNILEIKNLSITYKAGTKALQNLLFDVSEKEIIGIVGESGSGKTTLAYALMGLLPHGIEFTGQILFKQKDILLFKQEEFTAIRGKEIVMISQEPAGAFNPVLSLGYQFSEVLAQKLKINNRKQQEMIILDAFQKVHLQDGLRIIKSYPHQLSGGQLQRAAIAMSVSVGAKILIADEPTSSLDVTIESQIINLFKELRNNLGLTIIFITHNLALVNALCDRTAVLYQGKLCDIVETKKLFTMTHDSYTKSLINAYNELEEI